MATWILNISKSGDSITCTSTVTPTVQKCFLMFSQNILCFSLCQLSFLVPGHHLNEPDSIIPTFSLHVCIVIDEAPPEPPLLQSEYSQVPQSFLTAEMFFKALKLRTGSCPVYPYLSCTEEPWNWYSTPDEASPELNRGEGSPPQPAGRTFRKISTKKVFRTKDIVFLTKASSTFLLSLYFLETEKCEGSSYLPVRLYLNYNCYY